MITGITTVAGLRSVVEAVAGLKPQTNVVFAVLLAAFVNYKAFFCFM